MTLDIKQLQRMIRETQEVLKYTEDLLAREKSLDTGDQFKINRFYREEKRRLELLTDKLNKAFKELKTCEKDKSKAAENIKTNALVTMKNEILRMYKPTTREGDN